MTAEHSQPMRAEHTKCAFGFLEKHALLPHEAVDPARLAQLRESLGRDGILYEPVIVDRESMVILDGHHRVRVLRGMGCQLIPAYLMDYSDSSIRVYSRRPGITVDKSKVIERGTNSRPFPARTSRHVFATPLEPRPTRIGKLKESWTDYPGNASCTSSLT